VYKNITKHYEEREVQLRASLFFISNLQTNIPKQLKRKKEIKTMEVTFAPRSVLEINDARIIFRNFKGLGDKYNREGDRNFAMIIAGGTLDDGNGKREVTAEEMADALMNDINRLGVGWNVKIKAPREEGDEPFIYLSVKIKFNDRGPKVYLKSGHNTIRLTEETIGMLDDIDISSVDLDIRPYDDEISGRPFRAAYVQSLWVTQEVDRFAARFAEEEHPEE
jgi:hypothetical protein